MEELLSQSESEDTDGEENESEFDSEEEFEAAENEEEFEELVEINAAADSAPQVEVIEDDDDKPNYIITKDANGGERYEYKEIGKLSSERLWTILTRSQILSTTQMIPMSRERKIRLEIFPFRSTTHIPTLAIISMARRLCGLPKERHWTHC